MNQTTDTGPDLGKWLAGAAAGALLMYLLDPDRGQARRARSADALRDVGKQGGSRLGNLGNLWDRIGQRVSSAVGKAGDSASRLAGRAADKADTMDGAAESGGRVRRLLGAATRDEWTPALRGSAVVGGGLLGMYALMRRSPLGMALGVAGLAMLARGAVNQPLTGLLGGRGLGQTVDLEKSIHIDASPEEVYDLWCDVENFPRFMSHVAEVRDLGRGRSHWVVRGPAGSEFEWNSRLTEQSRPHRLAWRTEPGAEIGQSGSVQFEPSRGGTRVTVRMSWQPPAGALGHGIAALLGADPRRQMDDDLARMKSFIERGAVPSGSARHGTSSSRYLH